MGKIASGNAAICNNIRTALGMYGNWGVYSVGSQCTFSMGRFGVLSRPYFSVVSFRLDLTLRCTGSVATKLH